MIMLLLLLVLNILHQTLKNDRETEMSTSTRSTSVSTSCCSTSGEPIAQVRSRIFITSLVAGLRTHQVSTGRTCFFVAVTTLHPSTWSGSYTGSLTMALGDSFDRQRNTSWWYLRGSAPSAIVHLELPSLVCMERLAIFGHLCTITGCFQEESDDPALSTVL